MIVAVIPAKGTSSRFPGKNQLLLYWSILYARKNSIIDATYVSTDNDEIEEIAEFYKVGVIRRPVDLQEAPLLDIYKHAYYTLLTTIGISDPIEYMIGLQPDNPDRSIRVVDVIDRMRTKQYDLLVSIGADEETNGAIRVYASSVLVIGNPYSVGVVVDNCTNVHYPKDLDRMYRSLLWWMD